MPVQGRSPEGNIDQIVQGDRKVQEQIVQREQNQIVQNGREQDIGTNSDQIVKNDCC